MAAFGSFEDPPDMPYGRLVTQAALPLAASICLTIGFIAQAMPSQDPPPSTIRNPELRWDALTNLTIVPRPGERIEDGVILMRDGVVVAAGANLEVPGGYRIHDRVGYVAYPGLIEPALMVDTKDQAAAAAGQRGAYHNSKIVPRVDVSLMNDAIAGDADALRKMGFCAAMVLPDSGLISGRGGIVLLDEEEANRRTPGGSRPLAMSLGSSGGWGTYPGSSMGVMALLRQSLNDGRWQIECRELWEEYPEGNEPPREGLALESMHDVFEGRQPVIIDANSEIRTLRGHGLAEEFELDAILLGSGLEFRRLEEIQALDRPMIIPLVFPSKPKVEGVRSNEDTTLRSLLTWKHAPENPARLKEANVDFALTTHRLSNRGDFRKNMAEAIKKGLSQEDALAAVTTIPAGMMNADEWLGTIEPGRIANLVVVEGDLFDPSDSIREVWIAGRRHEIKADKPSDFPEEGLLSMDDLERKVTVNRDKKMFEVALIEIPDEMPEGDEEAVEQEMADEESETTPEGKTSWRARNVRFTEDSIAGTLDGEALDLEGTLRFDLILVGEQFTGVAKTKTGETIHFMIDAVAAEPIETAEAEADQVEDEETEDDEEDAEIELVRLPVPLGAFGRTEQPQMETVLFRNGRIWTSADAGILEDADLLIADGRIVAVGQNLEAPEGARIFELEGREVTAGLIDCHSHTGIDGGVNEGGQNNTAEVRIGDVLDPDDINWYRQLAGGLTAANQLHGSANPIGGQNAVVKLRWGAPAQDMHLQGAKPGIKFALGENVVRPNNRYPDTRMGVAAFLENAFMAASEYQAQLERYDALSAEQRGRTMPPRRDLELDTLVEILNGDRIIHCHSYRQDEILMLLRTAERWGFTIGTLQHILEGYKVADQIAAHGAGASSFSDWWAYKMEVMDAIPYNGALMTDVGVLVSFNSDSNELARRMNTEASKAVRYGGVEPHEAWKFVTINPAKQLRIDERTGSIEPGKDADIVVWSGDPLSTFTRCEQTWIDGRRYFDMEEDLMSARDTRQRRAEILSGLVAEKTRKASTTKGAMMDGKDPVSGTWEVITMTQRMGEMPMTVALELSESGSVTGVADLAMMEMEGELNGSFDAAKSTLSLELTIQGQVISEMTLEISGSSMTGLAESAFMPDGPGATVTGKRTSSPEVADPVMTSGRGGLLARMRYSGEERLYEIIRSGYDPAEVKAGECGCGTNNDSRDAIAREAGR
jgi:N-acetylglucosamine-6-phosphate deacetylase